MESIDVTGMREASDNTRATSNTPAATRHYANLKWSLKFSMSSSSLSSESRPPCTALHV